VIALVLILVAFVLIAVGVSNTRNADRVIDEVLAFELRQIDRERVAGLDANKNARWQG
jgi:hypothetical protein